MKKLTILLAIMLFAAFTTKATVWTVSNDPNQPAQYDSIYKAHDAASPGDTILVSGSQTSYGIIYIKKRLVLIGAGFEPNNFNEFETNINQVYFDTLPGLSGASGSEIFGFYIYWLRWNTNINNIKIHRNYIFSVNVQNTPSKNLLFCNNIFIKTNGNVSLLGGITNTINVMIANNIFCMYKYDYGISSTGYDCISNANKTTIILNNLFSPTTSGYINTNGMFCGCDSATIVNNIFFYRTTDGGNNCVFANNIGYGIPNIVNGTNTGGNNIIADPKFIYVVPNNAFNYTNNYNLQATSPGKNAGTDNTDIGIYGGPYPFPQGYGASYRNAPMPAIPIIQSFNVNNSYIPQNSTLSITLKARKGDD